MGQSEPKLLQEAAKGVPFAWGVPSVKYALESEACGNALTRDEATHERAAICHLEQAEPILFIWNVRHKNPRCPKDAMQRTVN